MPDPNLIPLYASHFGKRDGKQWRPCCLDSIWFQVSIRRNV